MTFFVIFDSLNKLTDLYRLYECEEKNSDADTSPQKFDEPGRAKESKEADVDELGGVDDAAQHGDEVERVPRVFEVRLERERVHD